MEVTSNILIGDVRTGLKSLPPKSVHCAVTSPPYFGLRDYGVDGQLGLEQSPAEYIATMAEVFSEVHRVLRDDGTLWLNIGDSYSAPNGRSSGGTYGRGPNSQLAHMHEGQEIGVSRGFGNLPAKNLLGIPWRLAFALQDAGWILRQDLIWHKPAPMPESVTDRCTKSHEYIFLLTKSERYFYDALAIAEPVKQSSKERQAYGCKNKWGAIIEANSHTDNRTPDQAKSYGPSDGPQHRNARSVWKISTRSFKGAHFACFPPDLVEPCILAGTSAYGCCANCGSPWKRITNRTKLKRNRPNDFTKRTGEEGTGNSCSNSVAGVSVETIGWEPTCTCSAEVVPCTVLDPFSGSGTTGAVANVLGRNYVGTELNPDYAAMWPMRLDDVRKWWAKKNGKKPENRKPKSPRQAEMF